MKMLQGATSYGHNRNITDSSRCAGQAGAHYCRAYYDLVTKPKFSEEVAKDLFYQRASKSALCKEPNEPALALQLRKLEAGLQV